MGCPGSLLRARRPSGGAREPATSRRGSDDIAKQPERAGADVLSPEVLGAGNGLLAEWEQRVDRDAESRPRPGQADDRVFSDFVRKVILAAALKPKEVGLATPPPGVGREQSLARFLTNGSIP